MKQHVCEYLSVLVVLNVNKTFGIRGEYISIEERYYTK